MKGMYFHPVFMIYVIEVILLADVSSESGDPLIVSNYSASKIV